MFQKNTFGSTGTGFGGFNAQPSTSSSFGVFKPPGTGAFGAAPAFGATATQPATGGLFGATNTTTNLFGTTPAAAPAPAFGATNTGFGFGAQPAANTSLFGGTTNNLFGGTQQQNATVFGAKPAGFGGFGTPTTSATTGGVFGASSTSTGLFGQNNTMGNTSLFGNTTTAFGQQPQSGTGHVKYSPVVGTDVLVKGGASQTINIKHHCITCMKEYESKSLEELRLEDYMAGRKGSANAGVFGGGFQPTQTENKPLFGGTTTFGQPATTSAPSMFGTNALNTSGFGQQSTFSFGGATNANATTNLFGNKPAFGATSTAGTTSLFGTTTTTQAPAFGTTTTGFGFGGNTQAQPSGLFAPKTTTAFPAFGTTSLFGAKTQANNNTFNTAPAFGTASTAFGTGTTNTGSLFGNKTAQPNFGFGAPQANTGLGAGLSAFQPKPTTTGFPSLTSQPSLFNNPTTLNFNTGGTTLGSGLGFGNQSTGLGTGLGGMNQTTLGNTLGNTSLSGSAVSNVHEQILTLAARPYGDSPLFKDLVPDSTTNAEDALKPTNPAAVKAVLEKSGYRLTSPEVGLRLKTTMNTHKKSLFDGLEESDPSLEDKLSLKPSRKRLVLRPHQHRVNSSNDAVDGPNSESSIPVSVPNESQRVDVATETNGASESKDQTNTQPTDLEDSSLRIGSWLGSSKLPWNDMQEKPIDNEPTPRIYPDLDKELPISVAERRCSWLTTKPLRKATMIPDTAENSIRELRTEPRIHDKENIERLSVSEDENFVPSPRDAPPHPTGVKLTRPGYYTIPSLDDMIGYIRPDGRCVVPHLTIGRKNYGNVYYDCEIDVTGMDFDNLVHFLNKEVIIYPEDSDKPPVGEGLNRRATVTLDRVWPRDKTEKRSIVDAERLLKMDYESKLRRVCDKHDTKFIEYRPQTGSWVFRVEHFSKYGLTDSDEEDDITPEVLKRQVINQSVNVNIVNQSLQKCVAPTPSLGLGGLSQLLPQGNIMPLSETAFIDNMDTEENGDVHTMYPDNDRVYQLKSPTSELARLDKRHSHSVQLMKASLYSEQEQLDDDMSVTTGDQQVPIRSAYLPLQSVHTIEDTQDEVSVREEVKTVSELPIRPLIVNPHTVVLKYHRKIPPMKHTIAGRLNFACLSDLMVSRARHTRVGFGPSTNMTYVTTKNCMAVLDKASERDNLDVYLSGRQEDDWSSQVIVNMAIGKCSDTSTLTGYLQALLDFSEISLDKGSPYSKVKNSPNDRRQLLDRFIRVAETNRGIGDKFAVSNDYCLQVWKLCEALWGNDLDNDGVPGTDNQSIVYRHNKLIEWLTAAISDKIDAELAKPKPADKLDDSDKHSARVLTLLLGGRVLEACQLARDSNDLNMAVLIAQASSDSIFRSLVSKQLSLWSECAADTLISEDKMKALKLIAGLRELPADLDWLVAFHAVARYICPVIPSLEQIVSTYEWFFHCSESQDLRMCSAELTMHRFPLPPYQEEYEVCVVKNGKEQRVLDLRYELIRGRAFNQRPRLQPAGYSPDVMDYSLCFLLEQWLGHGSVPCAMGLAHQLEAMGQWEWAVHALTFVDNSKIRESLIKQVISRHMPSTLNSSDSKRQMALLTRLLIPKQWVDIAMAHRAKYENQPHLEAQHLVSAEQWNAAHELLMDTLMPTAVLEDKESSLRSLLEKMSEAACESEISLWEKGGYALLSYLQVCDEIRALTTSQLSRDEAQHRLEALRPKIVAVCRATSSIEQKSRKHACAVAELGSRLLQLCLACAQSSERDSVAHLASLVKIMKLPPDCNTAAIYKITSELAEQASESIAELEPVSVKI